MNTKRITQALRRLRRDLDHVEQLVAQETSHADKKKQKATRKRRSPRRPIITAEIFSRPAQDLNAEITKAVAAKKGAV